MRYLGTWLAAVVLTFASAVRTDTHKLVSSKYTFNRDIFPILRKQCGRCHWSGGIAPMSLMTYTDARAWGESLRAELIPAHMPPWNIIDNVGDFKSPQALSSTETDAILTWATGGTPEGDPEKAPPAVPGPPAWPLGPPDLVVSLPEPVTLPAGTIQKDVEFVVPVPVDERLWVRAVDVLPGEPAIVRNVSVRVRTKGRSPASEESLLALWVPGDEPMRTERGTAFEVPAGSQLVLTMHYRKTYQNADRELSDRTSVGLYVGSGTHAPIRSFTLESRPLSAETGARVVLARELTEDLEMLAFVPDPSLSNARVEINAIAPDRSTVPIVHLAARAGWARRYWFRSPLVLKKGTLLEAVVTLDAADGLLPPAASPPSKQPLTNAAIRLAFDAVRPNE